MAYVDTCKAQHCETCFQDSDYWSLADIFELMPLGGDEAAVESNMTDGLGMHREDRVWRLERLHILHDLTDTQLHEDPDYRESLAKIDQLTDALKRGDAMPPMLGVRSEDGLVELHDGHHRYNAYLRAGVDWAPVWVAPTP